MNREPTVIHRSRSLLVLRIAGIVVIAELLFTAPVIILAVTGVLAAAPGFVYLGLFLLQAIKVVLAIGGVWRLIMDTYGCTFLIRNRHLVVDTMEYIGEEKMYNLELLRTIDVKTSPMGRILRYGDIVMALSASGYYEEIELNGIANPHSYAELCEQYLQGVPQPAARQETDRTEERTQRGSGKQTADEPDEPVRLRDRTRQILRPGQTVELDRG